MKNALGQDEKVALGDLSPLRLAACGTQLTSTRTHSSSRFRMSKYPQPSRMNLLCHRVPALRTAAPNLLVLVQVLREEHRQRATQPIALNHVLANIAATASAPLRTPPLRPSLFAEGG